MITFRTHGIVSVSEIVSQSRLTCAASRSLAAEARRRIGRGLRHLTPGFGISGAAGPSLREIVRMRLASGDLFRVDGNVWAAKGDGRQTCVICSNPIGKGEVEYEAESEDQELAFAHIGCFKLWREESYASDRRQ
jgi:hypothetical protein